MKSNQSSLKNLDLKHLIRDGARVFIHGAAATPRVLLSELCEQWKGSGRQAELMHLHLEGNADWCNLSGIRDTSLFIGPNLRALQNRDTIDMIPCFLSEIPNMFRSGRRKVDVALVHCSPPDKHGYCTLGTSVDVARAAVDTAEVIIAQINPKMPSTHGEGYLHMDKITQWIEVDEELPSQKVVDPTPEEVKIGQNVAMLIPDGACIQAGIGAVPNAALSQLKGHKHLGIHTEMWSDGMLELIKCGAVDNSRKKLFPGKTVSGFLSGSRKLYDYVDDNPSTILLGSDQVNDPRLISQLDKVVAINSAIEIDLTGQVCADSVGTRMISGVGGQMDFIRGASLSKGGLPIIAITSRTSSGQSRIVPTLKPGAGVITTRAHVHYVVTEYGVADLYGKTLGERAKALIAIAHPGDREKLNLNQF